MCFGGKKMTITQDELAAVAALIRKSVQIIGQRLFIGNNTYICNHYFCLVLKRQK